MKKLFIIAACAIVAFAAPAQTTNVPVFNQSGAGLNSNPAAQPGPLNTRSLYFAPATFSYTNFLWFGAAYTNYGGNTIRSNTTLHLWQYLVNGTLVATNKTATNVWVGTNGTFRATSFWAQVKFSTTAPQKKNGGDTLSTNTPARHAASQNTTTNPPTIQTASKPDGNWRCTNGGAVSQLVGVWYFYANQTISQNNYAIWTNVVADASGYRMWHNLNGGPPWSVNSSSGVTTYGTRQYSGSDPTSLSPENGSAPAPTFTLNQTNRSSLNNLPPQLPH